MFIHDGLAFEVSNRVVDIRAPVSGDKEGGVRLCGNMLDVDMMSAMLAEALQQHIGVFGSFFRVDQRMFAAGEIILLNIDNDQGSSHIFSNQF